MSSQPAPSGASPEASPQPALMVPLRALVPTDLAWEAAFAVARRGAFGLLAALGWRLMGRSAFEAKLAARGAIDPSALPYDEEVLARAREAKSCGRTVTLWADTSRALAEKVAAHLGCFDAVTDAAAAPSGERVGTRDVAATRARALVRALRPHQWTKNALLFVPALLGHALAQPEVWTKGLWAFAAFSLCASSVYVLNDLLDLHADRAHHSKRQRPFASGALPLTWGLLLAPLLLVGAAAAALLLSPRFAAVLAAYYAATLAYSLVLKRLVLVDVLVLAGLYTVRIIAGSAAYQVPTSQWLLAFSLFIFLSLAFVKRYSEVYALRKKGLEEARGRGYRASDLEQLSSLGAASGYISVLVLALYVNSHDVSRLYTHPERLWAMLPLFLYWVSRVWLLAHRGQMHDDPIVFAIRDRTSYVVAALTAVCVYLAR